MAKLIVWLIILLRALDTQAPITMGEDDDEQTGAHGKWQVITHDKEQQDKPKYKRQEFMRFAFFSWKWLSISRVSF